MDVLQVLYVVGVLASVALSIPQGGTSEFQNLPEECRPKRPAPGQQREVCCVLPDTKFKAGAVKDIVKQCKESLGLPSPSIPPSTDSPPNGDRPARPHGHPRHWACIEECVFNKLGLLTSDMKLNPEAVTKTIMEEFGKEASWVPLIKEGVEKCLQTAPGDVRENAKCKSGAMELRKCITRHLYLNCPTSLWTASETCIAEKSLMEKCPNLHPKPPKSP